MSKPGLGQLPVVVTHERDHRFKRKPGGKSGCAVCGGAKSSLVHAGAPPSMNAHGSSAHPAAYQRTKRMWQERFVELLTAAGLPSSGRVFAHGVVCFPDRMTRDQGNYRWLVEKALGDALVEGGWIEDDDWGHYEFGTLVAEYEKGRSFTRLFVRPLAASESVRMVPILCVRR